MKYLFLILVLLIFKTNIYSENYSEKLLDISYTSLIQASNPDKAHLIALSAYKKYPNRIWIKRVIESGVWSGNINTAVEFAKKLKPDEIPQNVYPFIKISDPELYLKIIRNKINNYNYLKDYIYTAINISDDKALEYVIKNKLPTVKDLEKKQIIEYILLSDNVDMAIPYIDYFSKKDACTVISKKIKLMIYHREITKAFDYFKRYSKKCEDIYEFDRISIELLKINNNFNLYIDFVEKLYEKNLLDSHNHIEELFNYYFSKAEYDKAADVALYGLKKTNSDFFVYQYIKTKKEMPANVSEKFQKLASAMQIEKLNYKQREKLINSVLKEKNNISDFLWIFYEKGTLKEKQFISEKLDCMKIRDKDILNVMRYINFSVNENYKAFICHINYSRMVPFKDYYSESIFFEKAGYLTQSKFYSKTAFNRCKDKDDFSCLNTSFNFLPDSVYLNKIKNSSLSEAEKKEIEISYLLNKNMIENAYFKFRKDFPKWFEFTFKNYFNEKYEPDKFYIPQYSDLYRYYLKNRQTALASNYLSLQIEKNPDDYDSRKEMKENYVSFKRYEITTDFSSSKDIDYMKTELTAKLYPDIKTAFNYKAIKLKDKNFYSRQEASVKVLTFTINNTSKKLQTSFGLISALKDDFFIKSSFTTKISPHVITFDMYFQNIPLENITSELLLKENGVSLGILNKIYQKNNLLLKLFLSQYNDLDNKKISNSFKSEIYSDLYPFKRLGITPYFKIHNYSKEKNSSSTKNLLNNSYSKILPDSFLESGIGLRYQFKNMLIGFIIFKNSEIKSGYILSSEISNSKKTAGFEITYNSNSFYTQQNYITSTLFYRF